MEKEKDTTELLHDLVIQETKNASLKWNFLRGIFYGFGVSIGSVILVALFLYILSLFANTPVIGEFFKRIMDLFRS